MDWRRRYERWLGGSNPSGGSNISPSSNGLGRYPLKVEIRAQLPLGIPVYRHTLSSFRTST